MSQRNKRIYCTHKIDRYTKKKQQKELWGITNMIVFKKSVREFLGGPGIKTLHLHCQGPGLDPWLGNY